MCVKELMHVCEGAHACLSRSACMCANGVWSVKETLKRERDVEE